METSLESSGMAGGVRKTQIQEENIFFCGSERINTVFFLSVFMFFSFLLSGYFGKERKINIDKTKQQ